MTRKTQRWIADQQVVDGVRDTRTWIVRRGNYVGAYCVSRMIAVRITRALNREQQPFLKAVSK